MLLYKLITQLITLSRDNYLCLSITSIPFLEVYCFKCVKFDATQFILHMMCGITLQTLYVYLMW